MDLHSRIHSYQRTIADFIKERRTVKLLHLMRNYSALVVVISSAVLVSATNVAASEESSGFLFGRWQGSKKQSPQERKVSGQFSRRNDLIFVPLARADTAVDVDFEEEEDSLGVGIDEIEGMAVADNQILKDPEEDGGVKVYAVQSGDTIGSIAIAYGITTNTILWANDIDDVDSIMPGDKIFILPVAGLTYVVQKNDNLDHIAKKYKAEKNNIIAFNDLPANGEIEEGQEIVIPGGEKEIPQPAVSSGRLTRREYSTSQGGLPAVSGWKKLEGKAGTGHKFPYGYCTWYVAQKRYVPWGGNAGAWLYNAKVQGYKTGKKPKKGSIVVTTESWWGHVGIVEKVGKGTITISEMNYKGWAVVNKRTLSTKSRVIKGYIY